MVDSRIQLRSLSTGELTGIINIYPWFGGARKELCRRLAREGGASEEQFADMALHIPAREKIYRLLREPAVIRREAPEKPAMARQEPEKPREERTAAPRPQAAPRVRVAGGDYFSALSAKVCLSQEKAYYTSLAFVGSSVARDAVGSLLIQCLTIADGDDVDAEIGKAFEEAVEKCRYAIE